MNERDEAFSWALMKLMPVSQRHIVHAWRVRKRLPSALRFVLNSPDIALLVLLFSHWPKRDTDT